ncbi:MAG: ABC transporter permease, partial [Verrucomicrobia bacterium]|nr:ABC transporter permease [Verrucomicrobiota bacterium]
MAAGLSVAAIVLVGSLVVGDSVKYSLRITALQRIGKSHFAILGGERFFSQSLADRMALALQAPCAPVLLLQGSAAHPENERRANNVQVVGVDARFWSLASESATTLDPHQAFVNERLARQLNLAEGDTLVVRINKPSALPGDAMLASEEDLTVSMRVRISTTCSNAHFARFSLRAEQATPYTIFVPIDTLQNTVDLGPRANVILIAESSAKALSPEVVHAALDAAWTLADAQLSLIDANASSQWELRSKRVFLAPHVAEAAQSVSAPSLPILTYFVNAIQAGDHKTPYSMVSAVAPDALPGHTLGEDEILINTWLAEDLGVAQGDRIALRYYIMGAMRRLSEEERSFVVAGVLPFEGLANDRLLMPDLPGISDSENCREWEPGFPIDLDQIRDKDETYWKEHAGTPKAFIHIATGQAMWHNRYGAHTAIRYNKNAIGQEELASELQSRIRPTSLGIQVAPVRASALQAGADGMDFGSLFISFSFFLVAAALLLAAMLFTFNIEQRRSEAGLLLAAGFTRNAIRAIFLREGLLLAAIAGLVGVALGTTYTRLLLRHLETSWRDAIGGADLLYHAEPCSLMFGGLSGLIVGAIAILLVLRKQFQSKPSELLKESATLERIHTPPRRRLHVLALPAVMLAAAIVSGLQAAAAPMSEQGPRFFGSGMLLLVSMVSFCHVGMLHLASRASARHLTRTTLMLRGLARRPRRSLATMALLAAGSFMVIAVSAHRQDAHQDADRPRSGTGGFACVAHFSTPLMRDMNSPEAQTFYGIESATQAKSPYTQIRVGEGDEASCLNLNRPQRPRLWGVDPARLLGRFT